MPTLIAIPILGLAVLLQASIASRITLLQGPVDLVLLTLGSWILQERVDNAWQWALIAGALVAWISALPFWVLPLSYLLVTAVGLALRSRVWQIPVLALFVITFLGTLIIHSITYLALRLQGTSLDLLQAFYLITLPSLLLNLLLAIPIYGLIGEVASWVYPVELEI